MISTSPQRQSATRSKSTTLNVSGNLLLAVSALGASPQSFQLQQQFCELARYNEIPASSIRDRDRRRERFGQLTQQWRRDTQLLSSTTDIAMHPAYQAIIGMGQESVPWILADLRENSGHWYWALKAISNEDPVPPRDRGAVKKMKEAWLRWGKAKGLISA